MPFNTIQLFSPYEWSSHVFCEGLTISECQIDAFADIPPHFIVAHVSLSLSLSLSLHSHASGSCALSSYQASEQLKHRFPFDPFFCKSMVHCEWALDFELSKGVQSITVVQNTWFVLICWFTGIRYDPIKFVTLGGKGVSCAHRSGSSVHTRVQRPLYLRV